MNGAISEINIISPAETREINALIDSFNEGRSGNPYYISTAQSKKLICLYENYNEATKKGYDLVKNLGKNPKSCVLNAIRYMRENGLTNPLSFKVTHTFEYSTDGEIIQYGKYKGKKIADVIETDARYLRWMVNNPVNKPNKVVTEMYEAIRRHLNELYQKECEENRKLFPSQYLGSVGETVGEMVLTCLVERIKSNCFGEYHRIVFTDDKDNLVLFEPGRGTVNAMWDLRAGDKVTLLRARIKATFETKGKKMTKIAYAKFA